MIHIAKPDENLWVFSMGKRFRVLAIADSVDETNAYMERHGDVALIACFGELNIVANKYAGVREETG